MTTSPSVSSHSTVVATHHHLSAEVAGETVVLDNQSGQYFGFNALGNEIWALIQTPKTVSELCDAIMSEYDVDYSQCEQDIVTLLEGLAQAGLVAVQ